MIKEKYCPICQELLIINKKGVMKNKTNGEIIYIYTCEECNQAFAEDDNKIKLISYDSDMKPIKNECKICKIIKNYNQEGIFLLNVDTACYEFHCFDCSKNILQNWLYSINNKTKLNDKNIKEVSELYDFEKNNEMLQQVRDNPEKYKETMDKLKWN
jgi:RNase P subunit RPR2